MYKKILPFLFSSLLFSKELITPIPTNIEINFLKAKLGEKLFNDVRLSRNNTISCASCHIIDQGGDDNMPVSVGIDGQIGTRNSPTVLNARFNSNQFWDGRAEDLKDQVKGPIHNPIEMDSNFKEIIQKLSKDREYLLLFKKVYNDKIATDYIIDAITEFENSLITPNSRFDKYLKGEKDVLTKDEKEGYLLFKEYGCISCHNGINIGGNLMQRIGVVEKFYTNDLGRYNVTKNNEDKFYFKVPSLRNIHLTSPYFHDGITPTLKDAVNKMSFYQVGYTLKEEETNKIILFLKTLTGEIPMLKEINE